MLGFPVERSPWRKCSSSAVIARLWILGTALLCLLRGICHTLEQDGIPGKETTIFPAAIQHLSGCTGFWKSFLCFLQPDLLHAHRVLCLLFMSLRYSQVGRQKKKKSLERIAIIYWGFKESCPEDEAINIHNKSCFAGSW